MTPLLWALAAVNISAFFLCGIDKEAACKGKWRIPERTLFLAALPGGAAGFLLGMLLFRHKIRKAKFAVGMPLLLLAQAALFIWLLWR